MVEEIKKVNTMLPCEVVNVHENTVDVKPLIRRAFFIDGKYVNTDIPEILNVPVMYQVSGGYRITLPIEVGAVGSIIVSQRDITRWKKFGGIQNQNDKRIYDINDSVFMLGHVVGDSIDKNSIVIQGQNGTITVSNTEININAPTVNIKANEINLDAPLVTSKQVHQVPQLQIGAIAGIGGGLMSANIASSGTITSNGVGLTDHKHPIAWTDGAGSGESGVPVAVKRLRRVLNFGIGEDVEIQ